MALFVFGHIFQIQGGHPEHLSRSLTVTSGDDGGVHVHKIPLLEELMDSVSRQGPHPEHGLEGVGPGPQMGDGPQILEAVALLLQRVLRRGGSFHLHGVRLDLKRLLGLGRCHQGSGDDDSRSYVQSGDLFEIPHGVVINHLQRLKKGSVVDHDKAKALGIPDAAHPAAHSDLLVQIGFSVLI